MWHSTQANDYCGTHKQRCLKPLVLHLDDRKSGTNDIGNSYNVTGINIDKAAKIAYRLEVFICLLILLMLMPELGIQSATDLYGPGLLKLSPPQNFYAVGVGSAYGVLEYCASKGIV
jgi:hypothetical protein